LEKTVALDEVLFIGGADAPAAVGRGDREDTTVERRTKPAWFRWFGLAVGLAAVALLAASLAAIRSPQPVWADGTVSGLEMCELDGSAPVTMQWTGRALCNGHSAETLRSLQLTACVDRPDLLPMVHDVSSSIPQTVMQPSMMFRFHGADSFAAGGAGYLPADELGVLTPETGRQVWVLDQPASTTAVGDHGAFTAAVAAELLNSGEPVVVELAGTDVAAHIRQIEAVDPAASVVLVRLPLSTAGVVNEAGLVSVLESFAESPAVLARQPILNMSLTASSCGVAPDALRTPMKRIAVGGGGFATAAGNHELAEPLWPAAFSIEPGPLGDAVLSVGSVTPGGTRSCFSNHGEWVNSWFVGEQVETADGTWSGTSFAAPQAAAMLASGETVSDLSKAEAPGASDAVFSLTVGSVPSGVGSSAVAIQSYCGVTFAPPGAETAG